MSDGAVLAPASWTGIIGDKGRWKKIFFGHVLAAWHLQFSAKKPTYSH